MLFNSLGFLLFFPTVCIVYLCLPHRLRNVFLLVASYYFYMCWEPVYALLIAFSTLTTWCCGNMIDSSTRGQRYRRTALWVCLAVNFSILFVYKYLNFATASVYGLLAHLGILMEVPHFELLLPVGISFYTFQAVGYALDVYRHEVRHEKNLLTYALFVSFFPQLVAGPIERSKNLLPQFHTPHPLDGAMVVEGLKLMVWGYFMKLCIAENVSSYVDAVFNNLAYHNGTSILLALFFFTFQIFCDFGGYSLIAIGAARCLGFRLMQNFRHPYLATSVRDFWRRWHISLSSWFMDYVYIPLGGSRCSEAKHQRNLFVTMVVSGVWHGANWTFVLWGAYHGVLQCLGSLKRRYAICPMSDTSLLSRTLQVACTFVMAMLGWCFFRANSLSDLGLALRKMATEHGMLYNGDGKPAIVLPLALILLLMLKEMKDEYGWNIHLMHNSRMWVSVLSTSAMIILILMCASFEGGQFIYFQF